MKKSYLSLIVLVSAFLVACGNISDKNIGNVDETKIKENETDISVVKPSESKHKDKEVTELEGTNETMDLSEIKSGNYSSVTGTWENNAGETIIINKNKIEISNIYTSFDERIPATIKNLSIDIPAKNDKQGKPAKQKWIEGEIDSYGQMLSGISENGYIVLKGNIPMAALLVSFVPVGVSDNSQSSDATKERITAIISQNSATELPADHFYYRVSSNSSSNKYNAPNETEKVENTEPIIVSEDNVLAYAENYVKKYAPNWVGSFIFQEQLSDGSFKLFYDSSGLGRGEFIIDSDGTVTRLDTLGNALKSLEELYK